jgi:rhodanese-related sulfurtransferase
MLIGQHIKGEVTMFAKSVGKKRVDRLVESGAMLVDMRSPVAFRNGSVEKSVNLPLRNFLNQLTGMNRKQNIIVFGETENDEDVVAGVNYAAQMGFNVFVSDYSQLNTK